MRKLLDFLGCKINVIKLKTYFILVVQDANYNNIKSLQWQLGSKRIKYL